MISLRNIWWYERINVTSPTNRRSYRNRINNKNNKLQLTNEQTTTCTLVCLASLHDSQRTSTGISWSWRSWQICDRRKRWRNHPRDSHQRSQHQTDDASQRKGRHRQGHQVKQECKTSRNPILLPCTLFISFPTSLSSSPCHSSPSVPPWKHRSANARWPRQNPWRDYARLSSRVACQK